MLIRQDDDLRPRDGFKRRIAKAVAALKAHNARNGDQQDDLTDLLTDLRHFAFYHGIDWHRCERVSRDHFCLEPHFEKGIPHAKS